jgi:hypothetical protein
MDLMDERPAPRLLLILPDDLASQDVARGIAQAVQNVHHTLADRAERMQTALEEAAASGDTLRQALCRGQHLAYSGIADHLSEELAAVFDLWHQLDAQSGTSCDQEPRPPARHIAPLPCAPCTVEPADPDAWSADHLTLLAEAIGDIAPLLTAKVQHGSPARLVVTEPSSDIAVTILCRFEGHPDREWWFLYEEGERSISPIADLLTTARAIRREIADLV